MNKVYKIIWCCATQTFVAVSELTKTKTKIKIKSRSAINTNVSRQNVVKFRLAKLSVALMSVFAINAQVMATVNENLVSGGYSQIVVIGNATDNNGNISGALRKRLPAGAKIGDQSVTIGNDALATGNSSIAIGGDDTDKVASETMRYKNKVITIHQDGTETTQNVDKNMTVKAVYEELTGDNMQNPRYPVTQTGAGAVTIGVKSQAKGTLSTAFGTGANVAETATFALALGAGAKATQTNTVAIGAGSLTDGEAKSYDFAKVQALDKDGNAIPNEFTTYVYQRDAGGAGKRLSAGDYVSFGSKGYERQLKNVAAGEVSPTSTDAINGSQLATLAGRHQGRMSKMEDKIGDGLIYVHVNDGTTTQAAGDATKNLGLIKEKAGAVGNFAVTVGVNSTATLSESIAIGKSSNVSAESSIALGADAKAEGKSLTYEDSNPDDFTKIITKQSSGQSIAIGKSTIAHATKSIAIGANALAGEVTPKNGVEEVQGIEAIAIGSDAQALKNANIAIGQRAQAKAHQQSMAIGKDARAENIGTIALGTESNATGEESIAIGFSSKATGEDSIAQGYSAKAEAQNAVALGINSKVLTTNATSGIAIGHNAKVQAQNGIAIGDEAVVSGASSIALGASNTVANTNTFVLGHNVTTSQDNAVVLGNASTDRAHSLVTEGDVNGEIYNGFSGTATGVVSVGSNTKERQIINVAPGIISATSTDAINGSQLHSVAKGLQDKIKKPITFTGNKNSDTDADNGAVAQDGTQRKLGESLAIIGAATNQTALTRNTDSATQGTYSAKNIQTIVTNGEVQIQLAETPEFKGLDLKNDNNTTTLTTTNKGLSVGGDKITNVGNGEISATSTDAINGSQLHNAGWVLKNNTTEKDDTVRDNDIVNFIDGNATKAIVESNGTTSSIKYDVEVDDQTIKVVDGKLKVATIDTNLKSKEVVNGVNDETVVTATGNDGDENRQFSVGLSDSIKNKITANEQGVAGNTALINTTKANLNKAIADGDQENKDLIDVNTGKITTNTTAIANNSRDLATKLDRNSIHSISSQDLTVSQPNLVDDDIVLSIKNEAITTAKLAENAVTTNKITNNAVTKNKIDTTAVADFEKKSKEQVFGVQNEVVVTPSSAGSEDDRTFTVGLDETIKNDIATGKKHTTVTQGKGILVTEEGTNTDGGKVFMVKLDPKIQEGIDTNKETLKNAKLQFAGDTGDTIVKKLGTKIDIIGGKSSELTNNNIGVVSEAGQLVVKLAKNVDLSDSGRLIIGSTSIDDNGLVMAQGGSSITKAGIYAGGKVVTGVANGVADTDAVNVSQLETAKTSLQNSINTVKAKAVKNEGDITNNANVITALGNNTIQLIGDTGTTNSQALNSNIVFDIEGAEGVETEAKTGTNKVIVKLNEVTKTRLAKADSGLQNIQTTVNGDPLKTLNQADGTQNFAQGDNIVLENDRGSLKVSTQKNVNFDSVNVKGVVINESGVNANNKKITNVAKGTANEDAVNFAQLTETNNKVTKNEGDIQTNKNSIATNKAKVEEGLNFAGNTGTAINKKLGQTLTIKGDLADATAASSNNLRVDSTGNELVIKLADSPSFTGKVSAVGLDAGNQKITGVAKGTENTDAVNVEQLKTAKTVVAQGTNVSIATPTKGVNGEDVYTVNADGSSVSGSDAVSVIKGIKDTTTNITDYAIDLSAASKASLVKADSALQSIITQINGNEVTTLTNEAGKNIANFTTGDNIVLTPENGAIKVSTAQNVAFGQTTVGGIVTNATGINMNGQGITALASGGDVDTNAANIGDVKRLADSATTKVAVEEPLKIATTVNADGSKTHTIGAKFETLTSANGVVATPINVDRFMTAGNIADMINKSGFNVQANGTGDELVKSGETVGFNDGANVAITQTGKQFEIATEDTVVTAVTGGAIKVVATEDDDVTTADEFTLDLTDVTKANIQKGVDAKALVDTKGFTFTGDTGQTNLEKLDSIVAVNGDSNISTVAGNDKIQVKLNDNITVQGVTTNSATINNALTISPNANINMGGNVIHNVGNGVQDTDAVNLSQLKAVAKVSKTVVDSGKNVTVDKVVGQNGEADTYIVNAKDTTAHAGSDAVTVVATTNTSDVTDYVVDLSTTSKASLVKAESALQSINTTVNGQPLKTLTQDDNAQNFVQGKNIVLANKSGNLEIATAPEVEFDKVTVEGVIIDSNGINAGNKQVKGVAKGTEGTDAVNVTQLTEAKESLQSNIDVVQAKAVKNAEDIANNKTVLESGLNFTGDTGDLINKKHGHTLAIIGGKTSDLTENNIGVVSEAGKLNVKLAKNLNLTESGSLQLADTTLTNNGLVVGGNQGPSITKSGINAGELKITGVADGVADHDAVNVSQLKDVATSSKTVVAKGKHIASVVKTTGTDKTPDIYTINGMNIEAGSNGLAVSEDATAGKFTIDLSDTTKQALAGVDVGFNINADNGNEDNVKLTETIHFKGVGSNPNIVTRVDDNEIILDLNKVVTIGDVNSGDNAIVINSKTGEITGLDNTAFDPNVVYNSKRAATEEQLKLAYEKGLADAKKFANEKTFGLKDSKGNELVKKVDSVIDIVGADNNLSTEVKDGKLTIKLADTLTDIKRVTGLDDHLDVVTSATKQGVKPKGDLAAIGHDSATVNDILSAGWNLEVEGEAKDFVTAYDTLNFEGEGAITVTHEAKEGKQNIKIGIQKGKLETDLKGNVVAKPELNGFVTTQEVANAINNAGFNLSTNGADAKLIKSGHRVDMKNTDSNLVISHKDILESGKVIGQEVNYDLAKDISIDKAEIKNSLLIGDVEITQAQSDVITQGNQSTNALDLGGKTLTNIANNLRNGEGKRENAPTNVNRKNAASVNDVLNTGWNLQVEGEEKDFVKSYDTVNFKGENGIKIKHSNANDVNEITIALESANFGENNNGTSSNATAGFITAKKVEEELNKSGFTLTAQGEDASLVQRGESVNFQNTDGNLKVAKTTNNNDVSFDLADVISIKKVNADHINVNNGLTVGADKTGKGGIQLGQDGTIRGVKSDPKDPTSVMNAGEVTKLINGSNAKIEDGLNTISTRVDEVADNANAGVAAGIATANLPQPHDSGASMISAAVGHYQGQQAIAIGLSTISDNGKWIIKGSLSEGTQKNFSAGVGVGYQW
ncbi:Adhesin yadA precursor [Phocoenobacter uteri]|uniref:Adhesin yadA n=1 Tax=Phocoenobacter uteri TaxID=146806 RepID=A0A379C9V4_9PAST|nr:YadA-like family protein [Phocoenobacter uteri]MDG6882741.1 hypothetical protein [Phocoenobacter uteri]SUB58908.1 Adhesin yadA precursor [Phocoenobacter uteri]